MAFLLLIAPLLFLFASTARAQTLDVPMTKKVAVVRYDPVIPEQGNQSLSQIYGWANATTRSTMFVDLIKQVTNNVVNYQIVDNIHLNKFPLKLDGFRYNWATYSACRQNSENCHMPDAASYSEMMTDTNLCTRIQSGEVDEVWVWGGGYLGFDEFAFKIPGDTPQYASNPYNWWIYDGRKKDLPACGKTYFVMGWIPEVGFDNQIHSYGHRIESTMTSSTPGKGLWHRCNQGSYWTQFICTNQDSPGNASCGDVHYPPNGISDYNYSNSSSVTSSCEKWPTFPQLPSVTHQVNSSAWGSTQEGYLTWWLSHIPKNKGGSGTGILSNWWHYIVDYDEAREWERCADATTLASCSQIAQCAWYACAYNGSGGCFPTGTTNTQVCPVVVNPSPTPIPTLTPSPTPSIIPSPSSPNIPPENGSILSAPLCVKNGQEYIISANYRDLNGYRDIKYAYLYINSIQDGNVNTPPVGAFAVRYNADVGNFSTWKADNSGWELHGTTNGYATFNHASARFANSPDGTYVRIDWRFTFNSNWDENANLYLQTTDDSDMSTLLEEKGDLRILCYTPNQLQSLLTGYFQTTDAQYLPDGKLNMLDTSYMIQRM